MNYSVPTVVWSRLDDYTQGHIRALRSDANRPVNVGDEVVIYDPYDDLGADGVIVNIREQLLYIDVDLSTKRTYFLGTK